MKMQILIGYGLLFSAGVLIGTGATAQSPRKNMQTDQRTVLTRMIKQLPQPNTRFHQPLANQQRQQKPTETKSRFKAFVPSSYDGVFFIPSDSLRFFWNGTRAGNGNQFADFILRNVYYYPSNDLYEPKKAYITIIPDPDSLAAYTWNNGPGTYKLISKSSMSFDASGNVTTIINKELSGSNWENSEKNLYTYDAQGNITSSVAQDWSGTVWEDRYKTTYAYDGDGNLTEVEELEWDNPTSNWVSRFKRSFDYDAQGNVVREIYQSNSGGTLVNRNRYTMTYTNGNRDSEIAEYWDSGSSQWENSWKDEYTYDNNGQLKTILEWEWNSGTWEEDYKTIYTYDGAGNNTSMVEQYWVGSSWEYNYKESYTYDGDVLSEAVAEDWNSGNNSFEKMDRMTLSYNSYGQCTEQLFHEWDGTGWSAGAGTPKLSFYYEEYDDGGAGIHTALGKDDFQLYPNPATDRLTVKMDGQSINHIRIVDISGKEVFSSKGSLNTAEATLPVNHLANGIYLLQLQSGQQQGTRTFVVQR